jgi:hypothetical protein
MRRLFTLLASTFALALMWLALGSTPHATGAPAGGVWPTYTPDPAWQDTVASAMSNTAALPGIYLRATADYTATGDYLNYSQWLTFTNGSNVRLDAKGIPQVLYNGQWYYNAVTVSQYCLVQYGRWLAGAADAWLKLAQAADRLMVMQSADGSFAYLFQFPRYYDPARPMAPGWLSGMAQGQALSCLSRAYRVSAEQRKLDAGNLALYKMMQPVSAGGTTDSMKSLDPSLGDYPIIEEYTDPVAGRYTLNGWMFAMLGVYDWGQLSTFTRQPAGWFFGRNMDTLLNALPYFDVGGASSYDLVHLSHGPRLPFIHPAYQPVHLYLLHALNSIQPNALLSDTEARWYGYIQPK